MSRVFRLISVLALLAAQLNERSPAPHRLAPVASTDRPCARTCMLVLPPEYEAGEDGSSIEDLYFELALD